MNVRNKYSLVLVVLALTFSLVVASFGPASAAENPATTCTQWYTVVRGDYLVKIARLYDTDWRTLAEINNLKSPYTIYPGQKLCVSTESGGSNGGSTTDGNTTTGGQGRVVATSVKEDQSVTLSGKSLAVNTRYSVYLSKYGSYPAGAILVGSVTTDKYGAFTATFNLPKKLVDVIKIGVNLVSSRGGTASNWFINATADGNTGGEGTPNLTFSVTSVNDDDWVKIKTSNLPANVTFDVLMGKAGSKGINGIKVGTLRDSKGGSVKATFDIPEALQGRSKLDIRLENKQLGIAVYLTFEN
jgi:LysM repeat protein